MITSIVSGRARLRGRDLQHPATLQACLASLEEIREVTGLHANRAVGSLLVHYDASATNVEQMRLKLESAIGSHLPTETVKPAAAKAAICPRQSAAATPAKPSQAGQSQASPSQTTPAQANKSCPINPGQGLKLGMLATLGSSMYWAARGSKGPHKQTGALFLACMAGHMWMHRQRLLK